MNRVELWDAINDYAAACGGDTSDKTVSSARMEAVSKVEEALAPLLSRITELETALQGIVKDAEQRDDFETATIDTIARKALGIT